jgi:chemotaxis protein methyltransferase CheR
VTSSPDDRAADDLAFWISSWTGYSPEAIWRDAVKRVIRSYLNEGATLEQLHELAATARPEFVQSMLTAVSVGETFFFRQPDHFRWIAGGIGRFAGSEIRAWSAGCATGEEAYSLAACLKASAGPRPVRVLGTDLLQRNVESARAGAFGAWSVRPSCPLLYPVFGFGREVAGQDRRLIDERLRGLVTFGQHNILDDPPRCPEGFHVILCRNVLLYFSHESARAATARLASALAPDGVLVFGTLDVSQPPAGFRRVDPGELNIFERVPERELGRERPSLRPSIRPRASDAPSWRVNSWDAAIALHLRALVFIERGQRVSAEKMLRELRVLAPDYLPGILEDALLHVRAGDRTRAAAAMVDLMAGCQGLPGETVVPGPENLPVEYYRVAARTYLNTVDGAERV